MTDQLPQKPLTPPIPTNETERLAALHRYKVLDTPPEAAFDRITQLAARIFDMPTAFISLVDESRAWFKSYVGFGMHEIPRDEAFCSFAVLTDEPLIISDARLDDRFACNPLVQGELGVRFYAGAPLLSHDGFNLGTLCLLDSQPRNHLSIEQQATLVDLAAMVVDELELRLAAHKIAQVDAALLEITQGVATVTGGDFFDALVQDFAKALDVDYVYIGLSEGDDPKLLRTLTTCAHGQIVDNLEYPLQDTPCWEVIQQHQICCYPRNVQAHFPNAPLLKPLLIESYIAAPFFDSNGTTLGLLGVMDGEPLENVQLAKSLLTIFANRIATELERQQAEAALRESEAKYRSLFESIDEGVCTIEVLFDADDKPIDHLILQANPAFKRQSGMANPEGKTTSEFVPGIEQYWNDLYAQVIKTGESLRAGIRSDAFDRWFEVLVSRVGDGATRRVVIVFTDISDHKRAEAALRQSEEQSRNILESITDAFLSIDENWQFNYVNQTAYTLTGYEPGDLIGKNFWEAFPGLPDSKFEQMHRRVMRDRVPESLTEFYSDHDRWYEVRTYPAANGITIYFRNVTEQIKANEAVRLSEARFRRIFECNMIGMGIWTRAGGIAKANDALLDIIGYRRQDLEEGQINWQDITPPEQADRDQQAIAEIAVRGICSSYEKDYLHKQGHRVPILIGAAGFADDSEAGVFFAVDLSEQKQTEAALRESETRLRFMLDASQIGEWDLDLTTEPHTAHRSLRHDQIFGYESLLPAWSYEIFLDHVHPDDRAAVNQKFQETLSASTNWNFECRIIHPDQSIHWIWVRSSVYCNASGTPTRLLGMVVDITDRKLTEAALRESEELKQSILDSSKDCIKVLTLNSEVVYISAGGLCLLEIDEPTDILNASWVDFWQGEDYESAKIAIMAATSGSTGQFRGYLPTYKGTPKWWDTIITPVRNSAGAITQLVAISRDITRQKQAETEREHLLAQEQAAREAAETANRIKDEFLAVLSHELRSPLNPILGWSRLLQTRQLDAARQREALATIERNAKLQSQLIEDLLDISRIMQGKLTLNAAPVSLAFVISAAVETVSLAAAAKQIQIRLDLDPDVALISGDAARLQQVVWNLLTNAVKFTPLGGQVNVELRQLDSLAQIRVVDTGKGIHLNFLPYVFEYFRQEDGSTTRKFGGLGLGLAIVRQIVELHGGTVTAESQGENQGATFTVQLPTMPQTIPLISESTHAQASSEMLLDNIQILLVDDDPDTCEFQAFLLEQNGAKVIAAASGLEALQALEQFIPDVIVSDIGMAEIDGYMLMQQIRSRPPTQGGTIPAIALTAYAAEFDQTRALQAGFQRHMTKPLEPERFLSAIMNLLKQNRV